jgi:A/G-specific adenine glycosylase
MTSRTVVTERSSSGSAAKRIFPAEAREAVSTWFRPRRHAYAWRRGRVRDPWSVLVSEVMLQQTQVARVEPVFVAFLARFPTPSILAAASRADVLRAWAGLGYNRRAVALHQAARAIVDEHDGRVPSDPEALRRLPGVGPYTSAAVASIAFGAPVAAIDSNVQRIVARVAHGTEPDEVSPGVLAADAGGWVDLRDPRGWNEALMDLGRDRCRPEPRCGACPVRPWCRFAASGRAGRASGRRQAPFEGSARQARGRVLAALRERSTGATLPQLVRTTGIGSDRVAPAAAALVADGLAERTTAGRFQLPR